MTDLTFHPEPLTDAVEPLKLVEAESHDVPFGSLAVDLLEDSELRNTLARFYEPSWNSENLREIFYNSWPEGTLKRGYKSESPPPEFSARIILDYPLTNPWYADVWISSSRLGEIFGIAYDMYCHIYELDDAEWRKEGHQDKAPSVADLKRAEGKDGPMLINRAKGAYVWGHDMSDLVFETVEFHLNADWPRVPPKRMRNPITKEEMAIAYAKSKGEEPKESDVMVVENQRSELILAPIGHEAVDPKMPIGAFTFGIGS